MQGRIKFMSVEIKRVLGGTKEDIESNKYNIWVGISLGNKSFTKELIKEYIEYALKFTREDVLIVIPDRLHAVNIEIRDRKSKLSAHRKAWKIGDEKEQEVRSIIMNLAKEDQDRIIIARWHELQTKYFEYRLEIVFDEFERKGDFYNVVMDMVRENIKNSEKNFTVIEQEKMANYILYELPVLMNGANYGGPKSGKRYECIIYPGLGKLDYLIMDLHEGKKFPEFSEDLYINKTKVVIAEVYVK